MMRSIHGILYGLSVQKKKFFMVFGAPGVGKGTYAKMLAHDFSFNHISTGDEIRKFLNNPGVNDRNVARIREIVRSGGFVNDFMVLAIMKEKIGEPQSEKGVILDGFPRNENQLQIYLEQFPLDGVLNFELRQDILLEQIAGRRTCLDCGSGYNIHDIQREKYCLSPILPKTDGICDHCNGKLVIRQDDKENVVKIRLKEYEAKTLPLLRIFEKMGILMSIQAKKGVKDYQLIRKLIEKKTKQT